MPWLRLRKLALTRKTNTTLSWSSIGVCVEVEECHGGQVYYYGDNMRQLDNLVNIMVASVRSGSLTVGMLNAYLIREGVSEEELTLLLDIVALEVRQDPPGAMMVRQVARTPLTHLPFHMTGEHT